MAVTDRKSLLALRGVGPKSEAESVRFHERRVTKQARKSNTDVSGTSASTTCALALSPGEASLVEARLVATNSKPARLSPS